MRMVADEKAAVPEEFGQARTDGQTCKRREARVENPANKGLSRVAGVGVILSSHGHGISASKKMKKIP